MAINIEDNEVHALSCFDKHMTINIGGNEVHVLSCFDKHMTINIGGNEVHALNCARNLGAYFDIYMTMEQM